MRGKDVSGQCFGHLTALGPTAKRVGRSVVWRFRCDCGARVLKALSGVGDTVRLGRAPHCGCLNRGRASHAALDLSGHRYGRLTVMSCADTAGQGLRWHCNCDCGNSTIARTKDLRAGTTKSCGCGIARPAPRGTRWAPAIQPGEKFGRLTVEYLACLENGARHYWCSCECGGGSVVRGGLLTSGQTRSCGCLRGKPAGAKKAEHRRREFQTAGDTADQLRAPTEFRMQLNAEIGIGRLITCEPA